MPETGNLSWCGRREWKSGHLWPRKRTLILGAGFSPPQVLPAAKRHKPNGRISQTQ
jgi:hypothetical protein